MTSHPYTRGLHDLGNAVYAYLQPEGTWGMNNAGIIVDSGVSLLVDTLYDLKLTSAMLDTMRRALPEAAAIDMLVNTHADGDHCYGNQLVGDARIIASARTAQEMLEQQPEMMSFLLKNAPYLGLMGEYTTRIFGDFDFENIQFTPPGQTFEGELEIAVGGKTVQLLEVGPAHTRGDTLVYVPADRVLFSGDVLFIEGHPIMWAGPVGNWIEACERILALDVDVIVPGHGPITDKQGVARLKGYWEYLLREAGLRHAAGLSPLEAALDIPLDAYTHWIDAERLVVNVAAIYRELNNEPYENNRPAQFSLMAEFARLKGISR